MSTQIDSKTVWLIENRTDWSPDKVKVLWRVTAYHSSAMDTIRNALFGGHKANLVKESGFNCKCNK